MTRVTGKGVKLFLFVFIPAVSQEWAENSKRALTKWPRDSLINGRIERMNPKIV